MTFRWRLALTYSALLGLTLLIAGLLSYVALRRTLYAGLDESLRVFAQKQADLEAAAHQRQGDRREGGPRDEPTPSDSPLDTLNRQQPARLTVYDNAGQVVDWGPSRVGFLPRPGASQVGSERVFMLHQPGIWVQASQSDATLRRDLWAIVRLELLGAPLLLLLALGVGYVLADRALRPVEQVSDLADRIARSGQPGERVPQAPGADELARLTRTINDMLGKLDGQLARERLFAHASAHELRTPISVIRAATSLALEQDRPPEQYREILRQVLAVSEDMTALTTALMELARVRRPLEPRDVNLADVTLMAAELHSGDAHRKHVRLDVSIDDAAIRGDFSALVLAAGNLIQNAINYSGPHSTVTVACDQNSSTARLSVQDRGPGIAEMDLPRLLQPFQRGTYTGDLLGAGLGLALVQAIAEAHGGTLHLTNRPAGGLQADLLLPRLPAGR